jgi:hypothetical protein
VEAIEVGYTIFINMAMPFVGLRALQTCAHCTNNRVMHRLGIEFCTLGFGYSLLFDYGEGP